MPLAMIISEKTETRAGPRNGMNHVSSNESGQLHTILLRRVSWELGMAVERRGCSKQDPPWMGTTTALSKQTPFQQLAPTKNL